MFPEPDATAADAPPETKGYVYLFRADTGVYKIGSSKDPTARLQDFGSMPFGLELVHQMPSNDPRWVERMLHKRFAAKQVRGEWFALDEGEVAAIVATARCDRPGWMRRATAKRKRPTGGTPSDALTGRLDLRPHPDLRAEVVRRAEEAGVTMNDVVTEALCAHFGMDPQRHRVPRKAPGRKPGRRKKE